MEKVLATTYHTQINNNVLPFVTCGTTCIAETLSWLNKTFGKQYKCEDDDVMNTLNSPLILKQAQQMVANGELDKSALAVRDDNPKTPKVDESKYTHLNNFKSMLCLVANDMTGKEFVYAAKYLSTADIKRCIDNNFPVILSGKFTTGGHFITIVGYDDAGHWIVDDPYGDWNARYSAETRGKGAKLLYGIDKVDAVITFKKWIDSVTKYECITIRQA